MDVREKNTKQGSIEPAVRNKESHVRSLDANSYKMCMCVGKGASTLFFSIAPAGEQSRFLRCLHLAVGLLRCLD